MSSLYDNLGALALLAGEELPFKTEEDRAALVGQSVFYVRPADISDMDGKRHVFPRVGVVKSADSSTLVFDAVTRDGAREEVPVSVEDLRFVASSGNSIIRVGSDGTMTGCRLERNTKSKLIKIIARNSAGCWHASSPEVSRDLPSPSPPPPPAAWN